MHVTKGSEAVRCEGRLPGDVLFMCVCPREGRVAALSTALLVRVCPGQVLRA